jgi:hypothetical protein
MRKAIQLTVRLWIEAEDEPADDFAARAIDAVREMVDKGTEARPELRVRIQSIRER